MKARPFSKEYLKGQEEAGKRALLGDWNFDKMMEQRRKRKERRPSPALKAFFSFIAML